MQLVTHQAKCNQFPVPQGNIANFALAPFVQQIVHTECSLPAALSFSAANALLTIVQQYDSPLPPSLLVLFLCSVHIFEMGLGIRLEKEGWRRGEWCGSAPHQHCSPPLSFHLYFLFHSVPLFVFGSTEHTRGYTKRSSIGW